MSDSSQIVRYDLYTQVFEVMSCRILDMTWPPGTYLPNEYELSQEFKVSVGTIRRAVSMGVDKGMFVRQQGKGTYVAEFVSINIVKKINRARFGEDHEYKDWAFKLLDCKKITAPTGIAHRLALGPEDDVHHIVHLKWIEGEATACDEVYIPVALFPDISDCPPVVPGVIGLSLNNEHYLDRIEEQVTAVFAPPEIAENLKLTEDVPILRMQRVLFNQSAVPIEVRVSYCHFTNHGYYWNGPN